MADDNSAWLPPTLHCVKAARLSDFRRRFFCAFTRAFILRTRTSSSKEDGSCLAPAAIQPARRPTIVTLPVDLVAEARALGLNVSQACERGLEAEIARGRAAQWQEENREAIASSNEYVERFGLPLSEFRQF